jgi:hypothetical protein
MRIFKSLTTLKGFAALSFRFFGFIEIFSRGHSHVTRTVTPTNSRYITRR